MNSIPHNRPLDWTWWRMVPRPHSIDLAPKALSDHSSLLTEQGQAMEVLTMITVTSSNKSSYFFSCKFKQVQPIENINFRFPVLLASRTWHVHHLTGMGTMHAAIFLHRLFKLFFLSNSWAIQTLHNRYRNSRAFCHPIRSKPNADLGANPALLAGTRFSVLLCKYLYQCFWLVHWIVFVICHCQECLIA